MNEKQIDSKIKSLQCEIVSLKDLKVVLKSRKWWTCKVCQKQTILGRLTLGIEDYYVEPSGCSSGDYWTTEAKPPYHIKCPKCEVSTRHYSENDPLWVKIHENLDGFLKTGHGSLLNEHGGRWSPLGSPLKKFVFNKPGSRYEDVY